MAGHHRRRQAETATPGIVRDIGGRTIPNLRPDLFAYTIKEPAGVAAISMPWNFPLLIAAQKAAPALAAGCPVVLKPRAVTPRLADVTVGRHQIAAAPSSTLVRT